MTGTPRTDAYWKDNEMDRTSWSYRFASQLERELASLRREANKLIECAHNATARADCIEAERPTVEEVRRWMASLTDEPAYEGIQDAIRLAGDRCIGLMAFVKRQREGK